MRLVDGDLRISATDLSGFLSCKHLTLLNKAVALNAKGLPQRSQGFGALKDLEQRGIEHEARVLGRYRSNGWAVKEIPKEEGEASRASLTLDAIAERVDVIYQGVLTGERQFGATDFLVRSELLGGEDGDTYEVVDAKLAHSAKAAAVLQTTFYTRLLAAMTGTEPKRMHLELGNGQRETLRVADFAAYERATVARMFELTDGPTPTLPIDDPYPEKVERCGICSWRSVCRARRVADDDLSLVAGASLKHRRLLKHDGISTMTALAALHPDRQVPDMNRDPLTKLRLQAAAQKKTTDVQHPYWEFADYEEGLRAQLDNARAHHDPDVTVRDTLRGIFALPEPSEGDLFFDLEAARFFGGGEEGFGLEYLFGMVMKDGGGVPYLVRWAYDRDDEKTVFEWFLQFVYDRWQHHPDMHVYHYNHYEPTAMDRLSNRHQTMAQMLGTLMGHYGVKEEETDALLRNSIFVDLYPIFRQSIRAGIESYSLKQTEKVAGYERAQLLDEADEYMLAFQRALDAGPDDARAMTKAQGVIAAYNEDDCRATLQLRDWLEERRREIELLLDEVIPRPPQLRVEITPPTNLDMLKGQLRAPVEGEPDSWARARSLLADLLEFQRRDEKPAWWEYFELRQTDDEALLASRKALAGLVYKAQETDASGVPERFGNRFVHRFTFPPQDHGFEPGNKLHDPREFQLQAVVNDDGTTGTKMKDGRPWEIVSIDDGTGDLLLANMDPAPIPPPVALVVGRPGILKTPSESLERLASDIVSNGLLASCLAGSRLLIGDDPIMSTGSGFPPTEEPVSAFAVKVSRGLGPTYLAIQGPPGTGKTYTGAEIAIALLADDPTRRIGVTGPSHQAIRNFLAELAERRDADEASFTIGQFSSEPDHLWDGVDAPFTDRGEALDAVAAGTVQVLGGTAWLWSHDDATETVDALIVDEAGQIALALVVASSSATRDSLILLGDPQQLAQVSQGTHPEGAGASALEHVLRGLEVMPEGRGLFIDRTRRMHGEITAYISKAFYDGKLEADPTLNLDEQTLLGPGDPVGSGIRVVEVRHEGNDSSSVEEAEVVAGLVGELVGRTWVDVDRESHVIAVGDVMVVTPYNAQIREIRRALEVAGAPLVKVGTVDGFQGDEAAVVIYSMASSSADEAPRGMGFLYQSNRLNVAISRAMAMAIVAMSPELIRVDCKTPRQMKLANAVCLAHDWQPDTSHRYL
jgi:uncharacterized protein